jgi:glycosyltransferase involved in cell wall biosynthesis
LIPKYPRVFYYHQLLKDTIQPHYLISIHENRPQFSSANLTKADPCFTSNDYKFKILGFHRPSSRKNHDYLNRTAAEY